MFGVRSLAGRVARPARLQLHRPSAVRWRSSKPEKEDPYIEMSSKKPGGAPTPGGQKVSPLDTAPAGSSGNRKAIMAIVFGAGAAALAYNKYSSPSGGGPVKTSAPLGTRSLSSEKAKAPKPQKTVSPPPEQLKSSPPLATASPPKKLDLPPVPTDADDVGQLIDRLEKIRNELVALPSLPDLQRPGVPRAAVTELQDRLTSLREAAESIRSRGSSALKRPVDLRGGAATSEPPAPHLAQSRRLSTLQADLSYSQTPEPDRRDRLLRELRDQVVSGKATIVQLREELRRANESVEAMKLNLDEREKYLRDNISLLQEGRDIYNEAVAAYQELAAEAAANADVRVEQLNDSSKKRIRELDILDTEIKAMEHVLEWYSQNRVQSQRAVMMSIGMAQLDDHIKNGRPFDKEMRYIELSSHPESLVGAVCTTVAKELRKTGVPTQQQLELKWSQVEPSMREAAMIPEDANSLWNVIFAKAASYVMVSERLDKPGDDLQACISRIGYHLTKEDLRKAVAEAESISHGLSREVVEDWLEMAKNRLLVSEVFRVLRANLVLKNVVVNPAGAPESAS